MALWLCKNCTARYAVGLGRCPQCGTEHEEDGVAKITRSGVSFDPGHGPDGGAPAVPAAAEPVSVADQRAAGVAPAETVTIADQKAGVAPPAAAAVPAAAAAPVKAGPKAAPAPAPPKQAG